MTSLRLRSATLASALILGAAACSKDATTPNDKPQAPATPPLSSMQIDLGLFNQAGARDEDQLTRFHWTNAVVRVLLVNAFVDAAFTPPFTLFELALHADPEVQEDGSYLWTWRHTENGSEVRIDLTGVVDGQDVDWELRVTDPSHQPPFDQARWFRGTSHDDGRYGHWIFEDPARGGAEYARIDWHTAQNGDAELNIQNLDSEDEGAGDVLTYALEGREASLTYDDASEDSSIHVAWDVATGAGSLIAPDYNEGARACWDAEQQDVECDPAL